MSEPKCSKRPRIGGISQKSCVARDPITRQPTH